MVVPSYPGRRWLQAGRSGRWAAGSLSAATTNTRTEGAEAVGPMSVDLDPMWAAAEQEFAGNRGEDYPTPGALAKVLDRKSVV